MKPGNIFLWHRVEKELARAVGDRQPGCTTLDLCALAQPGRNADPIAQIRKSNEIFQGISIVRDPDHLQEDIYFQAQMASLAKKPVGGRVALRPIAPAGGAPSFVEAAQQMTPVLRLLTWERISARREWTYPEWLEDKIGEPGPIPSSQGGGTSVLVAQ